MGFFWIKLNSDDVILTLSEMKKEAIPLKDSLFLIYNYDIFSISSCRSISIPFLS